MEAQQQIRQAPIGLSPRPFFRGTALAVAAAMLAGCATTNGGVSVRNDPGDICAVHRDALTRENSQFDNVLQNAAIGAVAGGLGALLMGGNARQAAFGAAAGAVVGGVGTLAYNSISNAEREKTLNARYGKADAFNSSADRAQVAFAELMRCRGTQVQMARSDLRAGTVTRTAAQARIDQVAAWKRDDLIIANAYDQKLQEQSKELVTASNEISAGAAEQELKSFSTYSAVLKRPVTVRSSADPLADGGRSLAPGQIVRVADRQADWVRIEQGGRSIGYVKANDLVRENAPKPFTGQAAETVRSAPAADAGSLGSIAPGQRRQVTAQLPGWLAIDMGRSQRGFVPSTAMAPASAGDRDLRGQEAEVIRATATSLAKRDAFTASVRAAGSDANMSLDG